MVLMVNPLTVAPPPAMQHDQTNSALIRVVLVLLDATNLKSFPNPLHHHDLTRLRGWVTNRLYNSRFPENYGGVDEFIDSDPRDIPLPGPVTQTHQEAQRGRGRA